MGIPGEKHRFTTNNAKKDIQPGIRNYAENSNFKENPNKRYQPWGAPIEKIYNQQNIWQFPKQSVTMQREREIPTQVLSRNRFQILADTELEEENCLLPDQTLHTFVGAQATTPTKSKQRDNCPGLANQDKQDQYGIQTETTKTQSFGRRKPTVAFIGDSILRGIKKQEINKNVRNYYTVVKTFPGATIEDMESYMVPTLNKKPDGLIIHCGTNNLRSDKPEETAKKILNVALTASRTVRSVAVSRILARGDSDVMESKQAHVNNLLERSLETHGIDFIKHENFDENWQDLLYDDGIHLNQRGTNVLGGNIVKFLNSA